MNDVLRVKEKADIVDIISSYLELQRAGKSFKGACPFHNEKTPSFFVSPERQSYYCFGCGAKGDVISFVEQYESLDFVGALKLLADRVGVELEGKRGPADDFSRMYSIMEAATVFFEARLSAYKPAEVYARERGLSDASITAWRIGYAPDEWRSLHDHLLAQKFSVAEMKEAGLIREIEGNRVIDLFRNRLIFPIRDASGRVIAFSGRTLSTEKGVPKYVNSPETHIFKKSNTLFGLYEAKQAIRKIGYTILVEGQMDVLMLHEKGLVHTMASSGTAFTIEQANILKRISPKLIILYDGDGAGKAASLRAAAIALGVGIETKIARVPANVDPADLALADPDKLKDVLRTSEHAIFAAAEMMMESEPRRERRVSLVTEEVLPLVLMLPLASLQEHFVQELAKRCGVSNESLMHDLEQYKKKGVTAYKEERGRASPALEKAPDEDRLVKTLRDLQGIASWLQPGGTQPALLSHIQQHMTQALASLPEEEQNNFLERSKDEASAFEAEAMYSKESDKDLAHAVDDLIKQLTIEILRKKFTEVSDPHEKFKIRKEIDTLQTNT